MSIQARLSTESVPQPPVQQEVVTLTIPRATAEALLGPINDLFIDQGDAQDEAGQAVRDLWTAAVTLASSAY